MKNRHLLLLACVVVWSLCTSPNIPFTSATDTQEEPVLFASLLPGMPKTFVSDAGLYVPPAKVGMKIASPVLGSAGGGGSQQMPLNGRDQPQASKTTATPRPAEVPAPVGVELHLPAYVAKGTAALSGNMVGDAELVALVDGAPVPCLVSLEGEFIVPNMADLSEGTEIVMTATDANGNGVRAICIVVKNGATVLEYETRAEQVTLEASARQEAKRRIDGQDGFFVKLRSVAASLVDNWLRPVGERPFEIGGEQFSFPQEGSQFGASVEAWAMGFIRQLKVSAVQATAEPTAMPKPTPTPIATPKPTPGVAEEISRQAGEGVQLTVNAPPAWVDQPELRLTGTADPGAMVRMLLGESVLDNVVAARDGNFELNGRLPESGDHILTIEATPKEGSPVAVSYLVRYEMPKLTLTILAPLEPIKRDGEIMRGLTQPGAKIDFRRDGMVANVRANAKGEFSFRIEAKEEGDINYTLTASLKGYESTEVEHTVTRVFREQEALNAFRQTLVGIDYKKLLADPEKYEGKRASYRGRVAQIGDMDGVPCLLLLSKYQNGGWGDPVWLVCDELPPYPVDVSFTAYVECTGKSAPYTDAEGSEKQLPVMRLCFHAK